MQLVHLTSRICKNNTPQNSSQNKFILSTQKLFGHYAIEIIGSIGHGKILTYHPLHIQNSSALINVLLCCYRTRRELDNEGSLEFSNVVLHVAVHCCDLHKFVGINLTKSFNVNRPSILVNSMVSLWIIVEDLIYFLELEFLWQKITKERRFRIEDNVLKNDGIHQKKRLGLIEE